MKTIKARNSINEGELLKADLSIIKSMMQNKTNGILENKIIFLAILFL